ncbi:cell division protein FtsZ [Paludibacter propionicigenes WB4]|uniref:Cell division protein FtsZ n=1 Tax=Paludibacter propionicigenes (strain DSM 17365 / JCM 13257 / WB4) TaxID=694427 RepID=E4T4J7_PALPW|nr:cell division protein FtsZ [Paludibacter propionicigenes WB4]
MGYLDDSLPLELPLVDSSIIKVIGVGGGGGNAVNHMYRQGITDVSFVVCNTDNQALVKSPVPTKIQLGVDTTEGLGAGGKPEVARQAAEESIDRIQELLKDNTKMVFITAGMGGGTGTGASPVVAKAAHDLGILTVGIVTIPFAFEGNMKIRQALEGVAALSEHVDAILVINNEKLKQIYPDLELSNAFAKADDVLTNAAKAIAEIITVPGYINTDFADVYSIMKDGNVAIMNTGYASGENRITKAIEDALNSPLLNTNDVSGASKILLSLYCSTTDQIRMEEVEQIHEFMSKVGENVQVIWGASFDDELQDKVKITLIATGFDVSDIPGMPANVAKAYAAKPAMSAEASRFFDTPKPEVVPEPQPVEEVELEPVKLNIEKTYEQYYGNAAQTGTEQQVEPEPELPVFTLDDLEDEKTLKNVENIPAWKRRLMK